MKMNFRFLNSSLLLLLCIATAPHLAHAGIGLRIIRAGQGQIGLQQSYKQLPTLRHTPIVRLDPESYPRYPRKILKSWSPSQFTNPNLLTLGTQLDSFRLVVHGLELKELARGMNHMSFDDFVSNVFNHPVPLGVDFVKYYPFYLPAKTLISASVVTEMNPATFGKYGFTLEVPMSNYIASARSDMGTPTDIDFYSEKSTFQSLPLKSVGYQALQRILENHPLIPLDQFIPNQPIDTQNSTFRRLEKTPHELKVDRLMLLAIKLFSFGRKIHPDTIVTLTEQYHRYSWYNEVAIMPVDANANTISINGIFVRAGETEEELESVLAEPAMQILNKLASDFDLPVVQILNHQEYETDVTHH